jgi:hypothetical protein
VTPLSIAAMRQNRPSIKPRRTMCNQVAIRKSSPGKRRPHVQGTVPVAFTVFSAVTLMALCQLRVVADERAVVSKEATLANVSESGQAFAAPLKGSSPTPLGDVQREESGQAISAERLRLREGTKLSNSLGHFRQSGEAVSFVDESGREIGGLPNLNLERITRMLKAVDEPEGVWWSVSGTITEFAGRNYVLISRAVYKATAPPPAPESLTP